MQLEEGNARHFLRESSLGYLADVSSEFSRGSVIRLAMVVCRAFVIRREVDVRLSGSLKASLGGQQTLLSSQLRQTPNSSNAMTIVDAGTLTASASKGKLLQPRPLARS